VNTSDGAPRPVEVELKYRVHDEAAAERYLVAESIGPFVPTAGTRSVELEDRYVDTADGAMARAGFAVRLRRTGEGTIVSVKSTTRRQGSGSAHRRDELEAPADRTAGPLDWPPSDARSLVLEHAGDAPLVEVVTIRQLRRKRQLVDGATRVELSLDQVDVVARSLVVDRFLELEAELRKGDDARLVDLAAVFDADTSLEPSTGSKFERALEAARGRRGKRRAAADDEDAASGRPDGADRGSDAEPAPVEDAEGAAAEAASRGARKAVAKALKAAARQAPPTSSDEVGADVAEAPPPDPALLPLAKSAGVTADDHIAEAGRKVLRFHLARMLAREAGTREGVKPEDLHAMRVATRRQRAAWRVFGASFRPGRTKRYRKALREVAGRLGAVRDLDVLIEAADAYRADLPVTEQRALEPLLAGWREHRNDARVLLIRELDSDGYRRWVDDYREFVRTEGAGVVPVGAVEPHRVRDTAASHIWGAYEQVRAYEPVLRWADVETLHELRIAGKWLRYTIEFVREALGPDSAPLIARVTALQDHLGLMHDADVTASMARTFLVEQAGGLSALESAAIGRYLVSREREVARLRRTVGPVWRGVAGVGFRRGLGRVVAGL
jgi:CHAD domain-containing protein